MSETTTRYYGKYRGTVINNVDPEQRGRIQAMVPDVQGLIPTTWALPCVPMAGIEQGTYMVPQIKAGVWIEFEQGDPNYPIWVGGFWGVFAEVPKSALAPPPIPPGQTIVFQSSLQHSLVISDAPPLPVMAPIPPPAPVGTGGIILRSPTGATIVVNDAGIFINNGKGCVDRNGGTECDDQQSSPGGNLICPVFFSTSVHRCFVRMRDKHSPPCPIRACSSARSQPWQLPARTSSPVAHFPRRRLRMGPVFPRSG
jgi:hypothetical protein